MNHSDDFVSYLHCLAI